MKLFINAGVGGCAGVVLVYEAHKNEAAYKESAGQVTREVAVACEAAYEARADEIVVRDDHEDAANIDPFCISDYVTPIRGENSHPYNMISGLDDSFGGVMYVRYHAPAGNPGSVISHISTGSSLHIRLNGSCMSELMLNSYTAASYGTPILFLSRDRTICGMAREMVPAITTAVTETGLGASTYRKAPGQVEESIHQGVKKAITGSLFPCKVTFPETFTYEVTYKDRKKAYQMSFYPGMRAVDIFTNRLETSRWMDVVTAHCFVVYQNVKEMTAMDIEMFGEISDTFGPSGLEGRVVRTVAGYCGRRQMENNAMNNLYMRMPGVVGDRPVVQLDVHLGEYGFMVQCIHDNGYLGTLMLRDFHLTSPPVHTVIIKTRTGKKIRGIIMSESVYLMNNKERVPLGPCIENLYVDVGAANRREVEEDFGVSIGDSMVPEVSFFYDGEHELYFGKTFDNRADCVYIVDTMDEIYDDRDELAMGVVGAFVAQEEVGMRGTTVTTQVVELDLAILLEGFPSDDFFSSVTQVQGRIKNGVQIRRMDKGYISNPVFMEYAMELVGKFGIRHQEAVGWGGGTNAGKISFIEEAVPVLVLSAPSRYVHSHYNFCAKGNLEVATKLAVQIIKRLNPECTRHILCRDILWGGGRDGTFDYRYHGKYIHNPARFV